MRNYNYERVPRRAEEEKLCKTPLKLCLLAKPEAHLAVDVPISASKSHPTIHIYYKNEQNNNPQFFIFRVVVVQAPTEGRSI
jgi:hypothetical protein